MDNYGMLGNVTDRRRRLANVTRDLVKETLDLALDLGECDTALVRRRLDSIAQWVQSARERCNELDGLPS